MFELSDMENVIE